MNEGQPPRPFNSAALLPDLAKAISLIHRELLKTSMVFSALRDIGIKPLSNGDAIATFAFEVKFRLHPDSSEPYTPLDSGKDAASISDSDDVNSFKNSQSKIRNKCSPRWRETMAYPPPQCSPP